MFGPSHPPPFPLGKKSGSAAPLYWYTISMILSELTKPLLINRTAQSFPVYYLLLVPDSSGRYCGTARQTPPEPPPPPIFPSWAPLPPGKGISGIATTTDPVGKTKITTKSMSIQSRTFTKENSKIFIGNLMYSVIHKPFRDVSNPYYFLSKKIQILNKRSRL